MFSNLSSQTKINENHNGRWFKPREFHVNKRPIEFLKFWWLSHFLNFPNLCLTFFMDLNKWWEYLWPHEFLFTPYHTNVLRLMQYRMEIIQFVLVGMWGSHIQGLLLSCLSHLLGLWEHINLHIKGTVSYCLGSLYF